MIHLTVWFPNKLGMMPKRDELGELYFDSCFVDFKTNRRVRVLRALSLWPPFVLTWTFITQLRVGRSTARQIVAVM